MPRAAVPAADAGFVAGPFANPATLTFNSSDPDVAPTVTGTLLWDFVLLPKHENWTLMVRTGAATVANCPGIPLNAFRLTCQSISMTGQGGPKGSCASGPLPLTSADTQLAAGRTGTKSGSFTLNLTVSFTDSWQYTGAPSCSIALVYTLNYNLP